VLCGSSDVIHTDRDDWTEASPTNVIIQATNARISEWVRQLLLERDFAPGNCHGRTCDVIIHRPLQRLVLCPPHSVRGPRWHCRSVAHIDKRTRDFSHFTDPNPATAVRPNRSGDFEVANPVIGRLARWLENGQRKMLASRKAQLLHCRRERSGFIGK
jgi:hypothetical protein